MKRLTAIALGCALWGCAAQTVLAQGAPVAGIYTCTDAKGRRLTSDRPIPECSDREQKVLNPSGSVKKVVGPTLTAQERAAQEAKEKKAQEARLAEEEVRRRDKSLLARFPNQAAHDKERAEALSQLAVATQAVNKRIADLQTQRKKLDEEMEFYKTNPSKAPAMLRSQIEQNTQGMAEQKRMLDNQAAEERRINVRFDDELVRLRQLWPTPAR